jgi:Secretion system C-terminal sorting domain
MKKITLFVALLACGAGFAQNQITETNGENNPIYFGGSNYQFDPCTEENPNDGTFENGFNCSSASVFQTANDLTVAADENFTLSQITASIFANGGIVVVDVTYYEDNSGLPGTIMGSEAAVIPTSQAVIGSNFGFDVNEIVLDVTPFPFPGQIGTPTTYWVELSVTDGGGTGSVFWVVTSSTAVGNPTAQLDGVWGIPDPLMDGVYIWGGDCEPILAVGDNLAELVQIYPNPVTTRINIDVPANIKILDVALYDILGKNTGATLVNGAIDVTNLSRGVYILNVKSDQGTLTQKVIKR